MGNNFLLVFAMFWCRRRFFDNWLSTFIKSCFMLADLKPTPLYCRPKKKNQNNRREKRHRE